MNNIKSIVLFFSFLFLLGCTEEKFNIPVGYGSTQLALGDDFKLVEKKLGEELSTDVNGDNYDDENLEDFFLVPDQIEVIGLTLNPILYLTFNDSIFVDFSIYYTIDDTLYDKKLIPQIVSNLMKEELPGAKEVIESGKTSVTNNAKLYHKFFEVDTVDGSYDHLYYSIQAIP